MEVAIKGSDHLAARNILAQKQFQDIAGALVREGIDFVPLKGIVLLDVLYRDIRERFLEDIDILVRPRDIEKIAAILHSLGYHEIPGDPLGWKPIDAGLPIDLHTDIWYLSGKEMRLLWQSTHMRSVSGIPCRTLPREEMLIHTVAHSFVHHGNIDGNWAVDVSVMCDRWGMMLDPGNVAERIERYGLTEVFIVAAGMAESKILIDRVVDSLEGRSSKLKKAFLVRFLGLKNPIKGHILRIVFQRSLFQMVVFIWQTAFPMPYFVRRRYNRKTLFGIGCFYTIRPFLLFFQAGKVVLTLLFSKASSSEQSS